MRPSRESFIPKGSTKISDKRSDAVAYIYAVCDAPYAAIFYGKQARPFSHYRYRSTERRDKAVSDAFASRQASLAAKANWKAERTAKADAFRAEIQVGDIFHYSFGYDETHHVFYEVTELKGKYATVRPIEQAQRELGYDNRHRCMPQSGAFCGEPQRVLIQDGRIAVDRHHHASKWNTGRVAGVPVGPSYTGGGMH